MLTEIWNHIDLGVHVANGEWFSILLADPEYCGQSINRSVTSQHLARSLGYDTWSSTQPGLGGSDTLSDIMFFPRTAVTKQVVREWRARVNRARKLATTDGETQLNACFYTAESFFIARQHTCGLSAAKSKMSYRA